MPTRTMAGGATLPEVMAELATLDDPRAGCTSPFAPVWIAEMVRRQQGG